MQQDREDDVALGADKYADRAALGTHAPVLPSQKDYREPSATPLVDGLEFRRWSFWRAGIAEFLASLLFLYVSVQTVMGYKRATDPCRSVGVQGIAWSFGGMIFVLVYCTAGISGQSLPLAITFTAFFCILCPVPSLPLLGLCWFLPFQYQLL